MLAVNVGRYQMKGGGRRGNKRLLPLPLDITFLFDADLKVGQKETLKVRFVPVNE